jgi:hypothetical protein
MIINIIYINPFFSGSVNKPKFFGFGFGMSDTNFPQSYKAVAAVTANHGREIK